MQGDVGPAIAKIPDYLGWTALHEACKHGSLECIRVILNCSEAPCDLLGIKASDREITPFHEAVLEGHPHIVELMMEKFSQENRIR